MQWNDRVQALKRSEKYRKDYEEYEAWRTEQGIDESFVLDTFEQKMSKKAKTLCEKYHIPFPIHPDRTMIFGVNGEVVGLMEEEMKTPAIYIDRSGKRRAHVLWDNRFLTIRLTIDTSKTQGQIEDEFKTLYKYLLSEGSKKQRVPRTSLTYQGKEINHWLVFDMRKEKKNLSRVMKELFGITKNPTYDKEAKARYDQVSGFYEKALSLLSEFEGK